MPYLLYLLGKSHALFTNCSRNMDTISKRHRSWNMSRIGPRNTRPERLVSDLLRQLRYKPQRNRRDLPGVPDFVLPRKRLVILVHGCFWHRHKGCNLTYMPKSNVGFWRKKFSGNVLRDSNVRRALKRLNWRVLVIWECQLRNAERLLSHLSRHLSSRAGLRPLSKVPTPR